MAKKRASRQPDFLAALIRTAYLPVEIPPVVTSKHFSNFCKSEYFQLRAEQEKLLKKSTSYETFTTPRTVPGRRHLAVVHPLAQLGMSLLITQHRSRIKDIISKSSTTQYDTEEDMANMKAFRGLDFPKWNTLKPQLYSEYKFILKADISRFFYTAYTHSIPWAIVGKEKAKDWLAHSRSKLNAHWSNALDMALQSCQSRETFGLPVGPDTSRVIAEILMASVEADKTYAALTKNRSGIRLVDDFLIGFDNEGDAHAALAALRRALWKFNLQLNDEKTGVFPSRSLYRDKWKLEFDAVRLSDTNSAEQERNIYDLIDLTLHSCANYGTSSPAHWACVRLSKLWNVGRNFKIIVDAMIRLARDFPSCTHHVAAFLISHQSKVNDPYVRKRVETWVKENIRNYLQHSHDFEVAWCLLICGALRIVVGESDFESFDSVPNAVNFSILGMLRERGLLATPLQKWPWRQELKKGGIYGENWLPFYEAVRRKWTRDNSVLSAVNRDPILKRMLAAKVTFLDDSVFDAATINVIRRTFKKPKPTSESHDVPIGKKGAIKISTSVGTTAYLTLIDQYDA